MPDRTRPPMPHLTSSDRLLVAVAGIAKLLVHLLHKLRGTSGSLELLSCTALRRMGPPWASACRTSRTACGKQRGQRGEKHEGRPERLGSARPVLEAIPERPQVLRKFPRAFPSV